MSEATGPRFNYDEEADILYVSFAPGEKATAAVELNDNILLRFNRRRFDADCRTCRDGDR